MPLNEKNRCPQCDLELDTLLITTTSKRARCPACNADITDLFHLIDVRPKQGGRGSETWEDLGESEPFCVMEDASDYLSLDEYHEQSYDLRFHYPRGWITEPCPDKLVIRPPDAEAIPGLRETAGFPLAVTLMVDRMKEPFEEPATFYGEFLNVRLHHTSFNQLLWRRSLTLASGQRALGYCFDFEQGGYECRLIAVAAARGNDLFLLDVGASGRRSNRWNRPASGSSPASRSKPPGRGGP